MTLTLVRLCSLGDETQVSYQSSTATLKDVDEGGKTVSITNSTVATYAFDDEPTLTSAEGDWNQHGDVGIQRGVGGWFNGCVCGCLTEWVLSNPW